MCTTSSSTPASTRPHRPPAHAAAAAPGAAGLGDAGAALVDAHRDGVGLRARLDDLQVDAGTLAAERQQVDGGDVVDADDRVRVAEAEVGDGTVGSAPMAAHPSGSVSSRDLTQSTVASTVSGSSVGSSSTRRGPASVRIVCGVEVAAPGRQGLGEAADAVAAHLGPAAVGVVQHHAGGVAVRCSPTSSPSAPTPVVRWHTRRANAGRSSDVEDGTRRGSRCRVRGAW